jgi:hypothetical protein
MKITQIQAVMSIIASVFLCKKYFFIPVVPDDTKMRLIFAARGGIGGKKNSIS